MLTGGERTISYIKLLTVRSADECQPATLYWREGRHLLANIFKLQQLTLKQCGWGKQLCREEETYVCIFDIGVNCTFKHSGIL